MRIVRQDLVCHGIDIFVLFILRNGEFDEVGAFQRRAIDWVSPMFFDPWQDICEVEDDACWGADGVGEGL